jgi:hypothetical protein
MKGETHGGGPGSMPDDFEVGSEPETTESRTAWERIDDMVPGVLHEWADDRGLAPGLVPVSWMVAVEARGFKSDGTEVEQIMILRSGSIIQMLGLAEYIRQEQRTDATRDNGA